MSKPRLSTTSYVVLGMIALRGPSTSYDLKRAVGNSVGYFWQFPHAQLYDEPARLAVAGLLTVEVETEGRRRRSYDITDAGRTAVRAWLAEPTGEVFQIRNAAELKLFFGELGEAGDITALAAEQVQLHSARLEEFEHILKRFAGLTRYEQRLVPLELGIALEHTALEFWRGRTAESGPID
jgi:PadR family transcriptional regulator, regulatory protein AphA